MINVLLLFFSFLTGAFNFNIGLYIFYFAYFFKNYIVYRRNPKDYDVSTFLISLILYSILLPDNYTIIGISSLILIYLLIRKKFCINEFINKKQLYLIIGFSLLVLLEIILNQIGIVKILFSLLYYSSIIIIALILSSLSFNKASIIYSLKFIIASQLIAIISKIIFHFDYIKSFNDLDWVTGTFGDFQANILFLFCAFSFIILISNYMSTKSNSDIIFALIAIAIAFSTGSVALTLLFIISLLLFSLFDNHFKKEKKFILIFIIVGTIIFLFVNPTWVVKDIKNLTNYEYLTSRISKIDTYKNTFYDMANEYPLEYIIGTGPGNYSSRSALTTTGKYIGAYSKIFDTDISEYTSKYILNQYNHVLENKLGSMDTPYSSIITLKGEFGLIGFVLFIYLFICIYKKSNHIQKLVLLFFVTTLFVENYIEFAKVVSCMLLSYYYLSNKNNMPIKNKILFVSGSTVGYGADYSMISAINQLKKNYSVMVILPGYGRTTDLLINNSIEFMIVPFKTWYHFDQSFIGRYIKPIVKLILNTIFLFDTKEYLYKKNYSPQLIYSNSFTNYYSIFLSICTKSKFIQHVREFGKDDFNWAFDFGFKNSCRLVNRYASKIIFISKTVRKTYENYFDNTKLELVYNGVPCKYTKKKKKTSDLIKLVMTGRLSFEKRQEQLIMAIDEIVKNRSDIKLIVDIYGDGPDEVKLLNMISNYKLGDIIKLKGYSTEINLDEYDIGIICSISEGFGRVTAEYMAAQLAVIGANSGATPELIDDGITGYLYDKDSFHDLATKIIKLVDDPDKIILYGENGYLKYKKLFSEERYAKDIEKICNNVIL